MSFYPNSNSKNPSTENGKSCKRELVSKYGCRPWVWKEGVDPMGNVSGVCAFKNDEHPEVIDDILGLRLIKDCQYLFECSFKDGRVANSTLNFTSAQGGNKDKCTRDSVLSTMPNDQN